MCGRLFSDRVVYVQWVITDARHDSTANAFHTTVPCLSGRYIRSKLFVSTVNVPVHAYSGLLHRPGIPPVYCYSHADCSQWDLQSIHVQ